MIHEDTQSRQTVNVEVRDSDGTAVSLLACLSLSPRVDGIRRSGLGAAWFRGCTYHHYMCAGVGNLVGLHVTTVKEWGDHFRLMR